MTPLEQGHEFQGRVEILDRVSGEWFSIRDVLENIRLTGDVFKDYSYGYQEQFVAFYKDKEVLLEPFYAPTFILGCLEIGTCLQSKAIFLTGGDEGEKFLIESDTAEITLSSIIAKSYLFVFMDDFGEPAGFYRIERAMIDDNPPSYCQELLRLKIETWHLLVNEWAVEYLALIDFLLTMKKGDEAQLLLDDRQRLILAKNYRVI